MFSTPASVGSPDSGPSGSLPHWSQVPEVQTQTLYNRISCWNDIWLIISAQYKGLLFFLCLLLCYFVSLCCCHYDADGFISKRSCVYGEMPLESDSSSLGLRVKWGGKRIWHPSRISSLKTAVPHPQEQHLQVTLTGSGTMWMSTLQSSQISAIRGESISDWMSPFSTDLLS